MTENKMPDVVYGLPYESENEYVRRDLYTALEQKNARLVEALEFYANQDNWMPHIRPLPIGNGTTTLTNVEIMGASKAKQALAENKE